MTHTVLPSLHGSQHHPNGSDKLPGGIFFDYANTGGYLSVVTTGYITINAGGTLTLAGNQGLINLRTGNLTISNTPTIIWDGSTLQWQNFGGSTGAGVIAMTGSLDIHLLNTGTSFRVRDHLNAVVWAIDETGAVTAGTVDGGSP
jgi:hypothetical protein